MLQAPRRASWRYFSSIFDLFKFHKNIYTFKLCSELQQSQIYTQNPVSLESSNLIQIGDKHK